MNDGGYPPGCTQADVDRAAGGYEPDDEPCEEFRESELGNEMCRCGWSRASHQCHLCQGSGEIVKNDHFGDPEWEYSIPCPECSTREHGWDD